MTHLQTAMRQTYRENLNTERILSQRLRSLDLQGRLISLREKIQQQERLLRSNMANCYDQKVAKADKLIEALVMLDTSRIVARGYAMVEQGGHVVDSVSKIDEKEAMTIQMRDGQVHVEVKDVQSDENI